MANFRNAVPASLRTPMETSKFAYGLSAQSGRMTMLQREDHPRVGALKTSVGGGGKKPFAPMPQEPEDAKMTGVTRSLTRRLLALNMPRVVVGAVAKSAA